MNEPFDLDFTQAAEKDLRSLRSWTADVLRHLNKLRSDPEAGHSLTGTLRGCRSLEFNLRGSGAFRALYAVDIERRMCTVFLIGPHENVYREAERRIQGLRRSGQLPQTS